MSKKVPIYSIMFILLFSLSIASVNAQFKNGTCINPNGGDYCGQKSQVSNCYCDKKCTQYKDCCIDYKEVCGQVGGGVSNNCTDSDGGINQYQKGITKGFEIGTKNDTSKQDYCIDRNQLVEYYCDGPNSVYNYTYVNNGIQNCTNGCLNGACIKESCNLSICVPYICCDPKNRTCPLGFPSQCSSCTKDICNSAEYKCNTDADCPQVALCPSTLCPQNSCVNGNCVLHTCGNGVCEKSEADYCPACLNSFPPCAATCQSGTCPSDCQGTQNITCKDSDRGKNYYVKGTSSDYFTPTPVQDACSQDNVYVVEYSCTARDAQGNIVLEKESVKCPNGCLDGACIKTNQITKQDVINWINSNCYTTSTTTDTITGSVIYKAPIIIP